MGRRPRERSETGIYHVILKGLDGRSLFYDGEDRMRQGDVSVVRNYELEDTAIEIFTLVVSSSKPKEN